MWKDFVALNGGVECVGGSGDVEIFHCHRRSRGYVERFH